MRNTIIGLVLVLAACSKPAEEKKKDPAPAAQPAPARPAEVAPPAAAPAPAAPAATAATAEEKAKAVVVLEEKVKFVTAETSRLTEDLTRAASEVERDQIKAKLAHLAAERAALAQEIDAVRR